MRPALFVLALTSCAAPPPLITAHDHGCSSGWAAAGSLSAPFHKDTQRYLHDPVYKSQWDDGFAVCKGQFEAIGRAMQR